MKSVAVFALAVASATAFVPSAPLNQMATRRAPSSLEMAAKKAPAKGKGAAAPIEYPKYPLADLVGYDIETGGVFDPLGFARNCPPEQMKWYRAAELKHSRVCMLAALGHIVQTFTHWDDPSGVFDQSAKPWAAMQQVYEQRPIAFVQIILAIFAVEIWGYNQQLKSEAGGDLGWDPFGLKPSNPEAWTKTQLRELKNGRLAMLAIAGMIAQEHVTGVGVLTPVDPLAAYV